MEFYIKLVSTKDRNQQNNKDLYLAWVRHTSVWCLLTILIILIPCSFATHPGQMKFLIWSTPKWAIKGVCGRLAF